MRPEKPLPPQLTKLTIRNVKTQLDSSVRVFSVELNGAVVTTYKYVGNKPGAWTDPQNWDIGIVPFWDHGSTINLSGSSVTLRNIEPNDMTVKAGSEIGTSGTAIVLDNAAFGTRLDIQVTSFVPHTGQYDTTRLDIGIVGYDTNYGTIEATHAQAQAGSYFLDISIGSGSQLNNAGTIAADGHVSDGYSRDTILAIGSADSYNRGVLNNFGQINVFNDTVASIEPAVIGTGTITLDRPNNGVNGAFPEVNGAFPRLAFLTSVAATQTVELNAGQLSLYVPFERPPQFEATITGWNTQGQVLLAAPFQGSSAAYTPTSPGHGDLIVSSTVTTSGQVGDQSIALHLAGNYATSDFVLTNNYLGTIVSIHS